MDGEWMPAKELKGEYRNRYDEGKLDKYLLAEKFLNEDMMNVRIGETAGMKR